jgi:tetratricopeptide (TPR) repeat protein
VVHNHLAYAICAAGGADAAIPDLLDSLTVEPEFPLTHWTLGICYLTASQPTKAIAHFERASQVLHAASYAQAGLAHAHALAGNTGKAVAILDELRDQSRDKFVPAIDLAVIHLGLREYDEAFRRLAAAAEQKCAWRHRLAVDPRTEAIRTDPRFLRFMRDGSALSLPAIG